MTTAKSSRRFYRLRTPVADGAMAVSVRIDPDTRQFYLAVGAGKRRMYVTESEGWTLWRCLAEALASVGEPPPHVNTTPRVTGSRS